MKTKLFSDREFNKRLLTLTLPIAFQSFMLAAVGAADAFMLGGLDQNAMAAVSLASQIQFIQNMFVTSVTGAGAILGAQYWGKKDRKTISQIFHMMLRWNILFSLLFFVGCEFFPRWLMLAFTDEEILIEYGISYLRIAGWSYLLTGISQCYLAAMKVTDHVRQSAFVSGGAVVLNILLNSLLIFGLFGFPKMEIRGAATATLITRSVELFVCILLSFLKGKGYIPFSLQSFFRADFRLTKDFIKITAPLLGAALVWGIGFTSYSSFMGHMGTDAAAANSAASVVRELVCCLCNGLASGGGILVGNELGAGNLDRGKLYGIKVAKIAFICGVFSMLVMFALTPVLLVSVKLTDQARRDLLGMMIIMAVYMIGRAVNTIIINGIFACGGDTMFDVYSLIVTMWGIAIPLAIAGTYFLDWPVLVVYACTCLDEVGKIPWVMLHFRKYKWVKDLTREQV